MTIRHENLKDGNRITHARVAPELLFWRLSLIAAGIFLFVFGLTFWLVGSWYTLRGGTLALNVIMAFFGFNYAVTYLVGMHALIGCIVLGLFYSLVEFGAFPRKKALQSIARRIHWGVAVLVVAIWLVLIASDFGSTQIGVLNPPPDSWPLVLWIAQYWYVAVVWSLFLTFIPETMMIGGIILVLTAPTMTDRN
ncbi:MAG: hypothetical protein HC828_11370 [Blastochloris sp.]|nr:hypothetical protein [Blastochloris sp.]